MIDRGHELSVTQQATVVGIARSTVYYLPRAVPAADLDLMQQIDKLHTEFPFAGSRMLRRLLAANGSKVGRRHVKTLMLRMTPLNNWRVRLAQLSVLPAAAGIVRRQSFRR